MWYNSLSHKPSLFTIEDICIGLKKLATHKMGSFQGLKAKRLKWRGGEAHVWISDMFNHALQHGMPHE